MRRATAVPALVLSAAAVLLAGCAAGLWIPVGPPEARVEVHGEIPAPGFVWIGGYWQWHSRWMWQPGHWEHPPRRGAQWISPHWEHGRRGWRFHKGHWR
jgi:hypothetical protein